MRPDRSEPAHSRLDGGAGPAPAGERRGVTLRAVAMGAALVAAIGVISPWAILLVKGSQLTSNAIPIIAVFFLFGLVALAAPAARLVRRTWAFSRAELITIYVMMLVGSAVVTTGFTGCFLTLITGPLYYASPENNWQSLFLPYLNEWLTPTDRAAVMGFYEGLAQGAAIPWRAWLLPLATWLPFVLVFYWVILCLGTMLRGQWVENERLVFPLTKLPLALVEAADDARQRLPALLKSRLMWLGFALPLVLHSWNSLDYYYDAIQKLALTGTVTALQGHVSIPFRLNLPVIGLGYLMPLGISFSVWFFFLFAVAQKAVLARVGLQIGAGDLWSTGGPPALQHEQAGALVVLAAFVLWAARRHLIEFGRAALAGRGGGAGEVLSPRVAVVGFGAGLAGMLWWLVMSGLAPHVAALLLVGALIVYIGLSRIVCEAGLPGCQSPMGPQAYIVRGLGAESLGMRNMTALGLSTVWMGETAANMMNAVVHTLKLSSTGRGLDRRLAWALGLAVVVGLAVSIWCTMRLAYAYGGINLQPWYFGSAPQWPFKYMASVAASPERSFVPRLVFTALGGGLMALLLFLRQRFVWWPLHPLGFPVSNTYTIISYDWFAVFMAWVLKGMILRYGGIAAYRALLPFFLGLILGEFSTACLWVFIDGAHGVEGNMIFNF